MTTKSDRFLPTPTPGTQPYWDACKRHELLIQQCATCGTHQFYPRTMCASCSGVGLSWVQASGFGTVTSWTVVRQAVSPAYAADVPYVIALIALQEGPTMMAQLVECEPEQVETGMAVAACFETWSSEISMPVFRVRTDA